jgi:hypothetical protein
MRTIHHETGGPTGSNLHGCRITTNDGGTAYVLMKGNDLLASSTNNGTLPTTPFAFVGFGLASFNWTLTVNTLTGGASSNEARGNWTNNAPNIAGDQGGEFTAQAGSGVGDDCSGGDSEEDSSAASA